MAIDYGPRLREFDEVLAQKFIRGQWTADPASRPGSKPAGVPYIWKWSELKPQLVAACDALPESFTARRALAFRNPELPRCTAQTISMTVQAIRPREIASTACSKTCPNSNRHFPAR